MTQYRTILAIICSSVFVFSGLIEILHPAPKISDFCRQASCRTAAMDIVVGKSEDYFGGLVPWLLGILAIGVLGITSSFLPKRNRSFLIFSMVLVFDVLIYGFVSRFIHFFSRWPVQSWIVIISIILLFGLIITYPFNKVARNNLE